MIRATKINVVEVTNTARKPPESLRAQFMGIAIIFAIILFSFLYLVYVGFSLTIANSKKYTELAEDNSMGKIASFGERGMIVDRANRPLVENLKTYDIYLNPLTLIQEIERQTTLSSDEKATTLAAKKQEILDRLPTYREQIQKIFEQHAEVPVILVNNAPKELVIALKEKPLSGIELRHSYSRHYLSTAPFAHLVGYTGIASEQDLLDRTDIIRNQTLGKIGLEYQYDKQLQGETRYDTYERDAFGNPVSTISSITPKTGSTLTLSLDKRFQEKMYAIVKKAVDSNKARGGSAVILDIHTGEVITMTSYPSFDSNEFVSGISVSAYKKLIDNPQSPLLFRPIAAQEPPGSTFKTIVATAALDTGTIDVNTQFLAPGVIYLSGGQPFQDYRKRYNGTLTVRDALMVSSNIFFCKTALKLGIERLLPYAENFGIGKTTGIDLPGEMRGRIPSPENKIWLAKNGASWLEPLWYPEGDTCNSAIGQGIALATPLQMANVAAAIANGGTVYRPFTVKKITTSEGKQQETSPTVIVKDIASPEALSIVRQGMRQSVSGSRGVVTALRYVPMKVAAKTGTAEFGVKDKNGYSTAHAWVIGFYPYDEPKYAFSMLIEGGGTSSVASFAMRDFLNAVY